jgi:hypothetical protein
LLLVLARTVILGFESYRDPLSYFSFQDLHVLKWSLFNERRVLTTTGHSVCAGGDLCSQSPTKWPSTDQPFGWSVGLLLDLAITVMPDFRILEIHDQEVHVSKWGLLFDEDGASLFM